MSVEPVLKAFEERLIRAGFVVHRSASNPVTFGLEHDGKKIGHVRVWAPLKPKFNEVGENGGTASGHAGATTPVNARCQRRRVSTG
jgi:hypothetical protein